MQRSCSRTWCHLWTTGRLIQVWAGVGRAKPVSSAWIASRLRDDGPVERRPESACMQLLGGAARSLTPQRRGARCHCWLLALRSARADTKQQMRQRPRRVAVSSTSRVDRTRRPVASAQSLRPVRRPVRRPVASA
eukprot:366214-Chlamydomonas_euryale.AAC.10